MSIICEVDFPRPANENPRGDDFAGTGAASAAAHHEQAANAAATIERVMRELIAIPTCLDP
jgi:hypothetical protein